MTEDERKLLVFARNSLYEITGIIFTEPGDAMQKLRKAIKIARTAQDKLDEFLLLGEVK